MRPLTRAQVRSVDQLAEERLGISSLVLMENAGRNAAAHIPPLLPPDAKVAILCGPGNNGGDGYVIARHLAIAHINTVIYSTAPVSSLAGDARVNADIAQRLGLVVRRLATPADLEIAAHDWPGFSLIVDALLGTGFAGPLRAHMAQVIKRCNRVRSAGVAVVAIDIPSGLDADTGLPSPDAIGADTTITFVAPKVGFQSPSAAPYLGRQIVESIGIPQDWIEKTLQG